MSWQAEEARAREERATLPYEQAKQSCVWAPEAHRYWKEVGYRDGVKACQHATTAEIRHGLDHYSKRAHMGPSMSYEAGLRDACRGLLQPRPAIGAWFASVRAHNAERDTIRQAVLFEGPGN